MMIQAIDQVRTNAEVAMNENAANDSFEDVAGGDDHPYFRVLNDEKRDRIHAATAEILEHIGVKVTRPEAVEMMSGAGCRVDGDIVRVPDWLLDDAIASAPKQFTLFDREGEPAQYLGSPAVYTHTGYTPLEFFDLETGVRRDYTLDDFRLVARVADALPNVDAIGQPGVVRPSAENPLEVINHLEFEAMVTNSSKPIHTLVASGAILADCLDMAEAVAKANGASSLSEKPFVMPMLNPISPLVYADDTVDKLLISVDRGIPVICGPMPLAGGTSPATLAGTIALSNAESLFGLVMSQVRRKGAPYVMITFAATMDMRTGDVTSGPEGMLMVAGCLEMGHHYRIPIAGGGAYGGRHGILDGDAGRQQMLGALTRSLLRGNAGVSIGAGSSLEAAVLADETFGMLKAMMAGVPVDDETLAVDVIRELGAGSGNYLAHPHTFRHFRAFWEPSTVPRSSYEGWVAQGRKTTDDYVKERLRDIMQNHRPKPVPDSAVGTMQDIIQEARRRAAAGAAA